MKELSNWSKDKPYLISIFAGHIISTVYEMSEEFKSMKLHRFASQKFPLPNLTSWFAMYRSHRKNVQTIKDVWAAAYGRNLVQLFSELLESTFDPKNRNEPHVDHSPEDLQEAIDLLQMLYTASEKELDDEFNQVPVKQSAQKRIAELITEKPLELGFYLFVSTPCWTLYRMSPTQLYRQARQGDFDSLEKLLRLDQLMLHDPTIGKQIITYRFNHSSSKYRKLLDAATKAPKGSGSRKNILLSQIALLSALSHLTQQPLTPQDLFELVEAFDNDSKGKLFDDLPKNPDALARSLNPDRNLWRQVFHYDKNM